MKLGLKETLIGAGICALLKLFSPSEADAANLKTEVDLRGALSEETSQCKTVKYTFDPEKYGLKGTYIERDGEGDRWKLNASSENVGAYYLGQEGVEGDNVLHWPGAWAQFGDFYFDISAALQEGVKPDYWAIASKSGETINASIGFEQNTADPLFGTGDTDNEGHLYGHLGIISKDKYVGVADAAGVKRLFSGGKIGDLGVLVNGRFDPDSDDKDIRVQIARNGTGFFDPSNLDDCLEWVLVYPPWQGVHFGPVTDKSNGKEAFELYLAQNGDGSSTKKFTAGRQTKYGGLNLGMELCKDVDGTQRLKPVIRAAGKYPVEMGNLEIVIIPDIEAVGRNISAYITAQTKIPGLN